MKIESVSVVTVTLNCADSISLTLDSVREQNCPNVEHIVIDGGSTDGTFELVQSAQVAHSVSEPDGGIYHAMEKGVKAALGDVIIFLNSGDIFFSQSTCREVLAYFRSTGAGVVFGDFVPFLIGNVSQYDHPHFVPGRVCRNNEVTNRGCLKNRNIHHQSIFYHNSVFNKCSYITPEFPQGSDYVLNVQALVRHRFSAKYFPKPVSKFALGGVSTSNFAREKELVDKLITYIRAEYFNEQVIYPKYEFLFDAANETSEDISSQPAKFTSQDLLKSLRCEFEAFFSRVPVHESANSDFINAMISEFRVRTDSIYTLLQNQSNTYTLAISELQSGVADLQAKCAHLQYLGERLENKLYSKVTHTE